MDICVTGAPFHLTLYKWNRNEGENCLVKTRRKLCSILYLLPMTMCHVPKASKQHLNLPPALLIKNMTSSKRQYWEN